MAVYTDIDDITLSALLDEYDLGPPLAFKGIAEGVENSNFLLETPKGRFILTVFEKRAKREVKRIRQEIRVARSVHSSVSREAHKLKMMVPQQLRRQQLRRQQENRGRHFLSVLPDTDDEFDRKLIFEPIAEVDQGLPVGYDPDDPSVVEANADHQQMLDDEVAE